MDTRAIVEVIIAACALGAMGMAWVAYRDVGRLRVVIGTQRVALDWLERENEKLNELVEGLKQELGDLRKRVRNLGYDPNHKTNTGRLAELPDE